MEQIDRLVEIVASYQKLFSTNGKYIVDIFTQVRKELQTLTK